MPEDQTQEQRPARSPVEAAVKSGGVGAVLSTIAYGLTQALLIPKMHVWLASSTVDAWVVPTLDYAIPGTVFGLVMGAVVWLGSHSRDVVFRAKKALEHASDPRTPERVADVKIPSATTQVIAQITP